MKTEANCPSTDGRTDDVEVPTTGTLQDGKLDIGAWPSKSALRQSRLARREDFPLAKMSASNVQLSCQLRKLNYHAATTAVIRQVAVVKLRGLSVRSNGPRARDSSRRRSIEAVNRRDHQRSTKISYNLRTKQINYIQPYLLLSYSTIL
jgi:hypothetical protein